MKFRFISAMLTALALLFAPVGMSGAGAMVHSGAVEAVDMAAHCAEMEKPEQDERDKRTEMGCTSACAAIPASHPDPAAQVVPATASAEAFQPAMPRGLLPESETPPPRFS